MHNGGKEKERIEKLRSFMQVKERRKREDRNKQVRLCKVKERRKRKKGRCSKTKRIKREIIVGIRNERARRKVG